MTSMDHTFPRPERELQEDTAKRISAMGSTPRSVTDKFSRDVSWSHSSAQPPWTSLSLPASPGALHTGRSYSLKPPMEAEGIARTDPSRQSFQGSISSPGRPGNWDVEAERQRSMQLSARQGEWNGSPGSARRQDGMKQQENGGYMTSRSQHLLQLHAKESVLSPEKSPLKLHYSATPQTNSYESEIRFSQLLHVGLRENHGNGSGHTPASDSSLVSRRGDFNGHERSGGMLNGHSNGPEVLGEISQDELSDPLSREASTSSSQVHCVLVHVDDVDDLFKGIPKEKTGSIPSINGQVHEKKSSNQLQSLRRTNQNLFPLDVTGGLEKSEDRVSALNVSLDASEKESWPLHRVSISKESQEWERTTGSFRSSDKSQVNRTSSSAARKKVMTLKEGPIEKKDGSGLGSLVNPWSLRRMVLTTNNLCWSKFSHVSFDTCINLLHIEGVEPSRNGGGQESFDVVVNEKYGKAERSNGSKISSHQKPKASRCAYTFRCRSKHSKGSPTERDMWIAAIREAMENARARKEQDSFERRNSERSSSPLSEEEDDHCSKRREVDSMKEK
ncbi:hypothetical protein GUITHDRAFT_144748 [Guillardia theta CCMP2712]|uniref:PH domain-containing protein n=1 Tax=Guillardia theta (strain CCMP2712) TaxID=905079 RepID=L1IPQ4_GUITC|nr:hypothetical protein GUITHDRAFT_144748 [Guillardia theta CCMP2712]EKX37780.1 hypothetical protein GUITHDRAFT_144748 [Guillardia theta CCMP2712]|eukprot:XP_005824760.1 hypothetical protein GUITHDRAFT_144748 [Guillardia theta CCMP2712]